MHDFDVLADAVALRDRDLIDVGCGDGALVRRLNAAGTRARGIEVSESQLARARAADPEHPERYLVGAAEALPLADASVDVALLMRSLHHAPSPDAALAELRRVVREIVYVAEPLPEGAFFELVSLVDDETEVRAVAQAAIARAPGYERVRTIDYDVTVHVPDLEALRARVVAADPARGERFAAVADELRRAFAPGDYAVPMRADVLRVVSSRP